MSSVMLNLIVTIKSDGQLHQVPGYGYTVREATLNAVGKARTLLDVQDVEVVSTRPAAKPAA